MPLLILYFNKGYRTANLYLAGFLFFASLYLLETFQFFYGQSLFWIAFFTNTHYFFYLIGPFAFFYVRGILSDNSRLIKTDYLHFALFGISFLGYIPYFFSSWDYKVSIAANILSENWDMAPFHINKIIPHQLDQLFNVAHTYFYSISLWVLLERYRKTKNNPIKKVPQYQLIKKWLLLFTGIFSVITINFTAAMANMWLYDDKSVFLDRASGALLFASIVYVMLNTMVMFFPHIMYGLPFDHRNLAGNDAKISGSPAKIKEGSEENPSAAEVQKPSSSINELQLFSPDYVVAIEELLEQSIRSQTYLQPNCSLTLISTELRLPAHHLTYYFNNIKKESFSNWRNNLRVAYAIRILSDDTFKQLTIEGIGEKVGFKSYSTFIRSFKKVTGKTPSDYMENRS